MIALAIVAAVVVGLPRPAASAEWRIVMTMTMSGASWESDETHCRGLAEQLMARLRDVSASCDGRLLVWTRVGHHKDSSRFDSKKACLEAAESLKAYAEAEMAEQEEKVTIVSACERR